MMDIQLKIIGAILLFLSLVHGFFPSYFQWKKELSSISLINRQMMYVHTFFIAFMVFQFFIYAPSLWKNKPFETVIHLVFSMFWTYMSVVFLLIYLQ